jgi:YbbR domain-containing protein
MKSKLTSILLSIAIAFGLWMYVITYVSPGSEETIYNIPVVLDGEAVLKERNLMIMDVSNTSVSMTLSGNRSDLNKVNNQNITLKVDLTQVTAPGERIGLSYTYDFPGDVPDNAFVVENKSPDQIYVTVEERRTKEVPVEVKWIGSAPEGFMSDREHKLLDYAYINVDGPASVADLIEKAVIEVDLREQRESIDQNFRYTLCDAEGNPVDAQLITTNVAEVNLKVKIQRVKEVKLRLDVTYGGGATEKNTSIEISPATIRVSGGEAVLEELGDELTIGKLNLAEITKSQELAFQITLPEGVTNETGTTEASVRIHFTGLSTREFVLDDIKIINVPEGMEVDLITQKLTVVLRGPTADVAKIKEEDVTITVDFTGEEAGTNTFKATIHCGEGYETVGAVGTYAVSATVKQKQVP